MISPITIALSPQGEKAVQLPNPIGGMILNPSTTTCRSFCGTVILYSPFFSTPFIPVICAIFAVSSLLPGGQEIVSFFSAVAIFEVSEVGCSLQEASTKAETNRIKYFMFWWFNQ